MQSNPVLSPLFKCKYKQIPRDPCNPHLKNIIMATFNTLINKLERKKKELERLRDKVLPAKVGNIAVRHFKKNFRDGGYNDNGLTKWEETCRQRSGGTNAASRFGPLLSRQNHLMNSWVVTEGAYSVKIENPVKYAPYHNEGADITVTPRMRKFAWRKFFEASKISKGDTASVRKQKESAMSGEGRMWKGLALTRKTRLHIPKRQFMGKPKELVDKVNKVIDDELKKVLDD